jgi:hypothetical protein
MDAAGWRVRVELTSGRTCELSVEQCLAGLPRADSATEFKCVEG